MIRDVVRFNKIFFPILFILKINLFFGFTAQALQEDVPMAHHFLKNPIWKRAFEVEAALKVPASYIFPLMVSTPAMIAGLSFYASEFAKTSAVTNIFLMDYFYLFSNNNLDKYSIISGASGHFLLISTLLRWGSVFKPDEENLALWSFSANLLFNCSLAFVSKSPNFSYFGFSLLYGLDFIDKRLSFLSVMVNTYLMQSLYLTPKIDDEKRVSSRKEFFLIQKQRSAHLFGGFFLQFTVFFILLAPMIHFLKVVNWHYPFFLL